MCACVCVVCAYVFVHVCRMDDNRQPKRLLFGETLKPRHFHGIKQRWGDVVNTDLKSFNIPLNDWYDLTPGFYQQYTRGISQTTNSISGVQCVVGVFSCTCGRSFRRRVVILGSVLVNQQ